MKKIAITHHAIKQYKEKARRWEITDEEAIKELTLVAKRGKIVVNRPGNVFEMQYNGASIVVSINEGTYVVITFLGLRKYRNWVREKEIMPRYQGRQKRVKGA